MGNEEMKVKGVTQKAFSYFEREKFLIGEGEVDLRVVPLPNPT